MTQKWKVFWTLAFKVLWIVTLTQAGERAWLSTSLVWSYTYFCAAQQDRSIWKVVGMALLCSLVGDGLLGWGGVLKHPDGTPLFFPPLWLLGLWAAFSVLLPVTFAWLREHLWMGVLLGAVSGVLSYVSGGKMGALTVEQEGWMWIALEWGIALPLLVWYSVEKKDAIAAPQEYSKQILG